MFRFGYARAGRTRGLGSPRILTGVSSLSSSKRAAWFGLVGVTAAAVTSCAGEPVDITAAGGSPTCSNSAQVEQWPLGRRLGQVLMGAVNLDAGEDAIDEATRAVAHNRVTGVNFFGTGGWVLEDNGLARTLDAGGEVPPLLAVDEEGGQVQRISGLTGWLPSARDSATSKTPQGVRDSAKELGWIMKSVSLNTDLAPVVDVGDGPLGDRTYSTDPDEVTAYAGAFADGLRRADVIPTLKHFPGMGRATGNTDYGTATTPPLSKLEETDLVPYRRLLKDGGRVMVMTANAAVPQLTDGVPASLSPATYELLRGDLGYDGVAITDSLSAEATLTGQSLTEAVEAALVAGADIALWDSLDEAPKIRKQLRRAVREGRLSEERLNEAVARVLALKGVDLCVGRD